MMYFLLPALRGRRIRREVARRTLGETLLRAGFKLTDAPISLGEMRYEAQLAGKDVSFFMDKENVQFQVMVTKDEDYLCYARFPKLIPVTGNLAIYREGVFSPYDEDFGSVYPRDGIIYEAGNGDVVTRIEDNLRDQILTIFTFLEMLDVSNVSSFSFKDIGELVNYCNQLVTFQREVLVLFPRSEEGEDNNEVMTCVICSNTVRNAEGICLIDCCGTYYHRSHLSTWFLTKTSCPYCSRTDFSVYELKRVDGFVFESQTSIREEN